MFPGQSLHPARQIARMCHNARFNNQESWAPVTATVCSGPQPVLVIHIIICQVCWFVFYYYYSFHPTLTYPSPNSLFFLSFFHQFKLSALIFKIYYAMYYMFLISNNVGVDYIKTF